MLNTLGKLFGHANRTVGFIRDLIVLILAVYAALYFFSPDFGHWANRYVSNDTHWFFFGNLCKDVEPGHCGETDVGRYVALKFKTHATEKIYLDHDMLPLPGQIVSAAGNLPGRNNYVDQEERDLRCSGEFEQGSLCVVARDQEDSFSSWFGFVRSRTYIRRWLPKGECVYILETHEDEDRNRDGKVYRLAVHIKGRVTGCLGAQRGVGIAG